MLLVYFLFCTVLYGNVELVIVKVEQGVLRGELRNRSTGNGKFLSFKGIPYAAPPIGKLRFKAPEPPLPWKGERDATAHGPVCPQAELGTEKYIPGDEDCLFLNVYTPALYPRGALPVMFFIHGGAFVSNSGNDDELGPDFLLNQNVILVTINYRLGALGFLSFETEEAPGNAGLKDQVAALRWVKKNIGMFGGDSNNITIFGQSAGGSSVSFHVLSPMSKGLFQRAISMSGVCFNDISKAFEPKRHAFLLTHLVGLYTKDPHEAFKFLQNAPVKDIVTAKSNLLAIDALKEYALKSHGFPPVVEKDFGGEHFLLESPEKLLLSGNTNGVDLIIGHTSQEGLTRAILQKEYIFDVYPYFQEMLVPSRFPIKLGSEKALSLADIIQDHYFGDKEISVNNMKEFITFFSYLTYVVDIHRYLEMWTKGGGKAYFYLFSCFSERNVYGQAALKYGVRGAGHLDDLMYVFDGKKYNLPLKKSSASYKMIVQTCTLFSNFAKYGNPTPDKSLGTIWKEYDQNKNALNIDLQLTLITGNMTEIDFWRSLYCSAGIKFS